MGNDNPIAFATRSEYFQEEMISCGNFSPIKDKDEVAFLSGHYLLSDSALIASTHKVVVGADNNRIMHSFKDSTNQQNKLKDKLRGKRVKITFETVILR